MPERGGGSRHVWRIVVALTVPMLLGACGDVEGRPVQSCVEPASTTSAEAASPRGGETQAAAIECYRRVDRKRIELQFDLPAGPACYRLARVELHESAAVVSVTLFVSRDESASDCPPEPSAASTQVEVQAPIGQREVRDGSAQP